MFVSSALVLLADELFCVVVFFVGFEMRVVVGVHSEEECVFRREGDHIVEAYSSMGRVRVLYWVSKVSFRLPHVVEVRALIVCSDLRALVAMLSMCVLHVNLGSSVRPKIFGCMFMGNVVLCTVRPSCVLYSAGSGVNRVQVVLSVFRMRLLAFVQVCMSCRYGCMLCGWK